MTERIDCTRSKCKDAATVILERNGRPYCRPHGLGLALKLPRSAIHPIDDIEDQEGILQQHAESDTLTVCRGGRVRGVYVKGCGQVIVWAKLPSGNKIPLDTEAIPRPKHGLVAYNPDTGGAKVLTDEDVQSGRAAGWAGKWRMTFHRTHFADRRCPYVQARAAGAPPAPEAQVA